MTKGPSEIAHREHRDAVFARKAALEEHGINSETFKIADARLTDAIRNLPKPIDTSKWQ